MPPFLLIIVWQDFLQMLLSTFPDLARYVLCSKYLWAMLRFMNNWLRDTRLYVSWLGLSTGRQSSGVREICPHRLQLGHTWTMSISQTLSDPKWKCDSFPGPKMDENIIDIYITYRHGGPRFDLVSMCASQFWDSGFGSRLACSPQVCMCALWELCWRFKTMHVRWVEDFIGVSVHINGAVREQMKIIEMPNYLCNIDYTIV